MRSVLNDGSRRPLAVLGVVLICVSWCEGQTGEPPAAEAPEVEATRRFQAHAKEIAAALSNEPTTIAYTTNYLKINALAEPFLAVAQILMGALQGAGDTKPVMWFTIICNWAIRLPVAYVVADMLKMGPDGVWWAMTISIIIQSAMVMYRYQSKKWIQLKI